MTDKMTLILVKKTGHVLGVVTRESDPEGKLEPADVAGEKLLVRFAADPADATLFQKAQFLVPANELAVEVKDFDPVVVTRPREYYLNADKQVAGTSDTTTLSGAVSTKITVEVSADVAVNTPVWIQISSSIDPGNTQVREGEIEANKKEVELDLLPLASGLHYILALVGGRNLLVDDISIP